MQYSPKKSRKLSTLYFVAMTALTTPGLAMTWQEGMDPASLRGSFFATCAECRVDGNGYLTCRCLKEDGKFASPTSLKLDYCSRSHGPENRNGTLACLPIMRGSWGQSCSGSVYGGPFLHASCAYTANGIFHNNYNLDNCPSMNLENIKGDLRCKQ